MQRTEKVALTMIWVVLYSSKSYAKNSLITPSTTYKDVGEKEPPPPPTDCYKIMHMAENNMFIRSE